MASELPTWPEVEAHALRHLHAARNEISEVRDWLHSDSPPTPAATEARAEVLRIVGEVKAAIDRAKDILNG